MATDATGSATSPDSIPTYATSADAPSGKGFNAAMAAIQTALSARVAKPSGIVSGEVPVWNGTTWVRSSATAIGTITVHGVAQTVNTANTDLAWFGGTGNSVTAYVNTGGGTLRSLGTPSAGTGTRLILRAAANFAILHQTAGGTGVQFFLEGGTTLYLAGNQVVEFFYDGGNWVQVSTPAPIIYRKTTAKQVVNTVTQTDLLNGEITVAGGALGVNGVLRITLVGDMLNNTGATQNFPRFFLRYNSGTTLIDTSVLINYASSSVRNPWKLEATIANLGATNSQWTEFLWTTMAGDGGATAVTPVVGTGYGYVPAPAGGVGPAWYHLGGASAVDSTASQAVVFAVINPIAHVNYDVTLRNALIEVV